MHRKLITIAVPTYNRAVDLDKSLSFLLPQIEKFKHSIHFMVSDNASTQDNRSVIDKYIKQGYDIDYVLQEVNIGMDGNFSYIYEKAATKYVWMISDDDILVEDGIETILNFLNNSQEVGSLYLSNIWYDANDTALDIFSLAKNQVSSITVYDDPIVYFSKVNYWITFLSANIINKDLLNGKVDIEKFQGTYLALLSWIIPAAFQGAPNAIVDNPLLICKGNNQGGYKLVEVFAKNFNNVLDYFKGLPKKIKPIINNSLLKGYFTYFILAAKEEKLKSASYVKENWLLSLFKEYYGNVYFYIYTMPSVLLNRNNYLNWASSKWANLFAKLSQ
jgi:abequosyltransferase